MPRDRPGLEKKVTSIGSNFRPARMVRSGLGARARRGRPKRPRATGWPMSAVVNLWFLWIGTWRGVCRIYL